VEVKGRNLGRAINYEKEKRLASLYAGDLKGFLSIRFVNGSSALFAIIARDPD
jgi:hypothetical protein